MKRSGRLSSLSSSGRGLGTPGRWACRRRPGPATGIQVKEYKSGQLVQSLNGFVARMIKFFSFCPEELLKEKKFIVNQKYINAQNSYIEQTTFLPTFFVKACSCFESPSCPPFSCWLWAAVNYLPAHLFHDFLSYGELRFCPPYSQWSWSIVSYFQPFVILQSWAVVNYLPDHLFHESPKLLWTIFQSTFFMTFPNRCEILFWPLFL